MCFSPFGTQEERVPRECINNKCLRLYCNQCVQTVRDQNGGTHRFRCMFCLMEYPRDKLPVESETLVQQLWKANNVKHGISYTRHLLSKALMPNQKLDLLCDIECRQRHLSNLISTLERFARWTQAHEVMDEAHILSENLLHLSERLKEDSTGDLTIYQREYQNIISISDNENDLGLLYIRLCERLLYDISDAEFCRAFPRTYVKMIEWNCALASMIQFQPHIQDLMMAIEQDVKEQWSKDRRGTIRAKIGVIGYTCAGKSTILNRLLGVLNLTDAQASPVRSIKSTYYPLQFDRKDPLISPDNPRHKTPITLVDIQGLDKDAPTVDRQVQPGNYLDEIRKADCDIYILVFDEKLRYEQLGWIKCIEQNLRRKCVLVRSKVDIDYLAKFRERSGMCFSAATPAQHQALTPVILEQLKFDNNIESQHVYLIAADYIPSTTDAELLLKTENFDMKYLVEDLARLAFHARNRRIHALAMRCVARVVNICFRRGYILNVLNYKIGAGVAAIIPFGDQLPRYLARDHIRQAFGVSKEYREYLIQHHVSIDEGCLQTSTLQNCVTATMMKSKTNKGSLGAAVGGVIIASAPFSDDILRAAAPTAIVLTGAARVALTASMAIVGVVISGAVCAWSAVDAGNHIFNYVNRLCDDIILVSSPLVETMIELSTRMFEQKH